MKKALFLGLGLVLILISCSSDNDENSTNGDIHGKWRFHEYYERYYDDEDSGFFDECPSITFYVQHKTNGELIVSGHDGNCVGIIWEGSWEKTGNTLVHTYNNDFFEYEILTLNNSTLKVRDIDNWAGENYEFITTFKRM